MNNQIFQTKNIIEVGMLMFMLLFLLLLFINRHKQGKGIGERIIQFTCISLLIPCIIILGIEKVLQGETIATLLGGLGGYVLSSMSQGGDDNNSSKGGKI
jgi:hypothetical protein